MKHKNMIKKYLSFLLILSTLLVITPVFAEENSTTTSSTPKLSNEQKILEAQRKLEERFLEAKQKLQERLTKLQTKQVNEAAATACVGSAVTARELAIKESFTNFSNAQLIALNARASGLSAAWSAPSSTQKQIRSAVNSVWAAYNTAHKAAVKQHNASSTAAWSTFKKAAATCKASQSGVAVDSRSGGQDMVQ
jgi:hypothetical protein